MPLTYPLNKYLTSFCSIAYFCVTASRTCSPIFRFFLYIHYKRIVHKYAMRFFRQTKVHLYEDFDYEAHFSRSKADFREMFPNTLLFREYLFAGSYSFNNKRRELSFYWSSLLLVIYYFCVISSHQCLRTLIRENTRAQEIRWTSALCQPKRQQRPKKLYKTV